MRRTSVRKVSTNRVFQQAAKAKSREPLYRCPVRDKLNFRTIDQVCVYHYESSVEAILPADAAHEDQERLPITTEETLKDAKNPLLAGFVSNTFAARPGSREPIGASRRVVCRVCVWATQHRPRHRQRSPAQFEWLERAGCCQPEPLAWARVRLQRLHRNAHRCRRSR